MTALVVSRKQTEDGVTMTNKEEAAELTNRWRVTPYNEDWATIILEALHDGMTMRECCRMQQKTVPHFPDPSTFYAWATYDVQGFATRYARARMAQAQHWAEDIIDISENGTNDWMQRRLADGTITHIVNHEHVSRSKLRVDTRKWLLSKLVPAFADKVQHQTLGADGQPVDPPSNISPIELSSMLKQWKPKG